MRDEVCFICVGQCAGNIGTLLEQRGYETLFINTADADLALLDRAKHVYKIPNERGCNQDREKAQIVFAQNSEAIMNKIKLFVRKRITYFISSTSGGTSGMTPLMMESFLEYLKEVEDKEWDAYEAACDAGKDQKAPEKHKAGFITVLPSLSESIILNANSYEYMRQVGDLLDAGSSNLANIFLIDNENNKDILKLNQEFVSLFDEVLKIPEKHKSKKGNVDPADLEEAITTPGVTVLAKVNKDEFSISNLIRELRSSSIFAQTESSIGKYWVSSTTEELDSLDLEHEIGAPLTHYKTYNDYTDLFVLSGLGFPAERVGLIADRAEEASEREESKNASVFSRDLHVKKKETKEVEQKPKNSVQDKLAMLRRRRG